MEIGLPLDRMIDIGLNLAGFAAAAMLFAAIRALFAGRDRPRAVNLARSSEGAVIGIPKLRETSAGTEDSSIEFVDLKGNNRFRPNNHHLSEGENNDISRNKQELIRLAKQILERKHKGANSKDAFVRREEEFCYRGKNLNLQGAGRIK
jgi:hypothetical protein